MELRHLRYFAAVAETLNYRRAAETLNVSQPALSKQIKDLEQELGAQLLNRNTGGVSLTDAGAVLLDEARDILERAEMAADAVREAQQGRRGRLTIGNLGAMSASFLPATLSAFRSSYPNVAVELDEMNLQDQVAALKAGVIQVGFTIDVGPAIPSGLEQAELLTERLTVAMGPSHRLAKSPQVSLADLAEEALLYIGLNERYELHKKKIHGILAKRHIAHRPIRRVKSYDSLLTLIAGDHGISILLPPHNHENQTQIVYRPIKETGDDLVVRLSAIWRKVGRSKLAANFVEVMLRQRNASGTVPFPNIRVG